MTELGSDAGGSAVRPAARVAAAARAAPSCEPRMYRIDPARSSITFAVRAFGLFTVRGRIVGATGTIILSPNPSHRSLRVRAEAGEIRTGLAIRDWHLKTRNYFDAGRHPEIRLHATRMEENGSAIRIVGLLTIRGNEREIDVEARLERDGGMRYTAHFQIDRRLFALGTGGRVGGARRHPADFLIARMADVTVELVGEEW
jgi:polyisoprenoid-binding protein YceI